MFALSISLSLLSLFCSTLGLIDVHAVDQRSVSQVLFDSLEELARLVDISYCVGSSGIHKPFRCLNHCNEFVGFELITTWNTGPLLSDSCGYIALSHPPYPKRVIVAFRGTYSIANTIADLSTYPSEYIPYPANDDETVCANSPNNQENLTILPQLLSQNKKPGETAVECPNCTAHAGFLTSWRNTRCTIIPHVEAALREYPGYELVLVGHSLGGAVAALAALEFKGRGWNPQVTTFGEPRVGNKQLQKYIDKVFDLSNLNRNVEEAQYRRVTHVNDPVPLLPLEEWGFRMHAGEIFISKSGLPFEREDLEHCRGDQDPKCIAGEITTKRRVSESDSLRMTEQEQEQDQGLWKIPPRYKLWELFFSHRDYFLRLGLCVPGGDPRKWISGQGDALLDIDNSAM